jgi:hypothetical protein
MSTKNTQLTLRSIVLPVIAGLIFIGFFLLALFQYFYTHRSMLSSVISEHIIEMKKHIEKIDKTARILSFEHEYSYIDFLTVKSFAGSEVGTLNLAYPHKWEGPYMSDNPTIQEKYYRIVRSKGDYFIVPGDGVELDYNKVIGKDIVFSENTDIEKLIESGELSYQKKPFAIKLDLNISKKPQKTVFDEFKEGSTHPRRQRKTLLYN